MSLFVAIFAVVILMEQKMTGFKAIVLWLV